MKSSRPVRPAGCLCRLQCSAAQEHGGANAAVQAGAGRHQATAASASEGTAAAAPRHRHPDRHGAASPLLNMECTAHPAAPQWPPTPPVVLSLARAPCRDRGTKPWSTITPLGVGWVHLPGSLTLSLRRAERRSPRPPLLPRRSMGARPPRRRCTRRPRKAKTRLRRS